MVLEDYGELMFLQTVLKKIGFDVDSIQNPRSFSDSLLTMNPDVLVMTAAGRKIQGIDLARTVKRVRGFPKVILIKGHSFAQGPEANEAEIDAWLSSPVSVPDLLDKIADLCGLNKASLQDKLFKLRMQENIPNESRVLSVAPEEAENAVVQGGDGSHQPWGVLKGSTMTSQERQSRYAKFLAQEAPTKHGFGLKEVQAQIKELRKAENEGDAADLEKERRAFVEHLFRKKSG